MTLYRFTVSLHGHGVNDVVDVADEDLAEITPLIRAAYLLPVYPIPAVGSDSFDHDQE